MVPGSDNRTQLHKVYLPGKPLESGIDVVLSIRYRPWLVLVIVGMMSFSALPGSDVEVDDAGYDNLCQGTPPDGDETRGLGEDGYEDLYQIIEGPGPWLSFGYNLATVGDVNGDGADDLVIGANESYHHFPPEVLSRNYLLLGEKERDFTTGDLHGISNMSAYWRSSDERWLGDVNGDGLDDVVSPPAYSSFSLGNWLYFNSLQVRIGTADGLPNVTGPMSIDVRLEGEGDKTRMRRQYAGVGDVNGDGFNDLLVVTEPYERYDGTIKIEGAIDLYYGSTDGMSSEPNWTEEIPFEVADYWRRFRDIAHADINGDGYSDVILAIPGRTNESWLQFYMGSEDGLTFGPFIGWDVYPSTIGDDYFPRILSPLNIDGDEKEDFVVIEPSQTISGDLIRLVEVFRGTDMSSTLVHMAVSLSSDIAHIVEMADINGDGLDDVVAFAVHDTTEWLDPSSNTYEHRSNLSVSVWYNRDGAYPDEPDWQHVIEDLPIGRWRLKTTTGDFDGDGYDDLALAQYDNNRNGTVVLIFGAEILGLEDPVIFEEGPTVYAGYKAYDIIVDSNPIRLKNLPQKVQLVLDPEGVNVTLECGLLSGGAYFEEKWDPGDHVQLLSSPADIEPDMINLTQYCHFRIIFGWAWPHEDMCEVNVVTFSGADESQTFPGGELFRVENDLELIGTAIGVGGWQGELAPNGWVRAGENVSLRGPKVVYENSTDLHPPAAVCDVTATDDDGDAYNGPIRGEGVVDVLVTTDDATDVEETITMALSNLPGTAEGRGVVEFLMRVDGDVPTFRNAIPDSEDWHSRTDILTSITAEDATTSGVSAPSFEYAISTDGIHAFGDWTQDELEVTPSGPAVETLVEVRLPDGQDNYIVWRVEDRVGNRAKSQEVRVKVDTKNVTFSDPFPTPGQWQTSLEVECGVTIRDVYGSGIDPATIGYRLSPRNLSQYGEWSDWNEPSTTSEETIIPRAFVQMNETPFNYIQWRAFDIAGNGLTLSGHYRVSVDVTPISFSAFEPLKGTVQATSRVECWVIVSDAVPGSGVDQSSVEYRHMDQGGNFTEWASVGMSGSSMSTRFSVVIDFGDGLDDSVQFRGYDVAGNGPTPSPEFKVSVDTTPPDITLIDPDPDARQPDPGVFINVTFLDAISDVDAERLWYRSGINGPNSLGQWVLTTGEAEGLGMRAHFEVEFSRGQDNVLQFRAFDVLGNEGLSQIFFLWVNEPPRAVIAAPEEMMVFETYSPLQLSGEGSHDDDGDDFNYTWRVEPGGAVVYGQDAQIELPEGNYTITLTVRDGFGGSDSTTVTVELVEPEVISPPGPTLPSWLAILLVIIITVVAFASYYVWRRKVGPGPKAR